MPNTFKLNDRIAKKILGDVKVAIAFLKSYLSEDARKVLNLSTLQPTSESAINSNLKEQRNDLVFTCKTKDNKDTYIYLLIEHQSTPDRFICARMLRYKMEIWGKHIDATSKPHKLPNIEALVLYHGKKPYPYKTDFASCCENSALAAKSIRYNVKIVDLTSISEQDILKKKSIATAFELILKLSHHKDLIRKIENYMATNPEIFVILSVAHVKSIMTYIALVSPSNKKEFKKMEAQARKIYGENKANKIFTMADGFRQEGRLEGRKEGRQEGRQEEKKEIAKNLLKQGLHLDLIANATGLTQKEIKAFSN